MKTATKSLDSVRQAYQAIVEVLFSALSNSEALAIELGGEQSLFVRLNQGRVRQVGEVDEAGLALRLFDRDRQVAGSLALTGDLALDQKRGLAVLGNLRTEIQAMPEDPLAVAPDSTFHSEMSNPGQTPALEDVLEFVSTEFRALDLAGIYAAGTLYRAVSTSAGARHWYDSESFSFDYSLITPEERMLKDSFAGKTWPAPLLRARALQKRAELEQLRRTPRMPEPGRYDVLLGPAAVADLLNMFSWNGLGEGSLRRGRSGLGALRPVEGEPRRLSPLFSLSEDFETLGLPRFNDRAELAPATLPLIEGGHLKNTLISTRTAREYGIVGNQASDGEGLRAPVMAAGALDKQDMLSELGAGLYIPNLHYLNWSDLSSGRVTGMTRYACFVVEDGRPVAPLSDNLRFDESLLYIFGEGLAAVSSERDRLADVSTYYGRSVGATLAPAILVRGLRFTL